MIKKRDLKTSGLRSILISIFLLLIISAFFLTALAYSDSNGKLITLFYGSMFIFPFIYGVYISFKIKTKEDLKRKKLLVPLFFGLSTIFFLLIYVFTHYFSILYALISSIIISALILFKYIRFISKM